ncbi:MAG: hypothetical protein HY231_19200 [Acidobacteria bacterium]|nr:hypothetical protein [Acidobacteriota bacterium]
MKERQAIVTFAQAKRLCNLVEDRIGIVTREDRFDQTCGAIEEILTGYDYHNFEHFFDSLATAQPADPCFQTLLERVTIGETFFFRDAAQFKTLREVVLPELIRENQRSKSLTILSAGCSSGEEPYSLAILLHEMLLDRLGWKINLIGGDINAAALARATQASYSKWSFRGVEPFIRERYFKLIGERYQLADEIRRMVRFQHLNLAQDLPFCELDLILCRNVKIYFSPGLITKIASRCFSALRDGGWLIVGASELSQQYFHQYEIVNFPDTVFYRKNDKLSSQAVLEPPVFQLFTESSPFASQPESPWSAKSTLSADEPVNAKVTAAEAEADLPKAEQLLTATAPEEAHALYLLAKLKADSGEYAQARQCCQDYINQTPDQIEGYYLLALICQAEGKLEAAVEALRRALFLDSSFVMGHWSLGLLYRKLGEQRSARLHLTRVKKLLTALPGDSEVAHSEGQTAARLLSVTTQILQGVSE